MELEALEASSQVFLAVITPPDHVRTQVVELATQYLNEVPPNTWLWLPNGEVPVGLEPLARSSVAHWLAFWAGINQHNVLWLERKVGIALKVLSELDFTGFLKLVESIDVPAVLRTIANEHVDNPKFNLALARSSDPFFASLGALNQFAYLVKLEAYGEALVAKLDPYAAKVHDTAAARTHRANVAKETAQSLRVLLESLGGGAAHDELLGELLAKSSQRHYGRLNSLNSLLLNASAEKVADRLSDNPAREVDVVHGLSTAPTHGLEAAEAVASKLSGGVAVRWRHRLLQHLGSRLLTPSDDCLSGPHSSETDPMVPRDYHTEKPYILQCTSALKHLSQAPGFDLTEWFKDRFGQLCLLPSDRGRNRGYAVWSAGTSRAALLMLIGAHLLGTTTTSPWRAQVAKLLGKELESRLGDWAWHRDVGHHIDAATLEHAAIQELGRVLTPEHLTASYARATSAWTLLAIAGPQAQPGPFSSLPDKVASSLEADLYLLAADMLVNLMWHLASLGYWDDLDRALQRYRLASPAGFLERLYSRVLEGFVVLAKGDVSAGLQQLQTACEEMERAQLKELRAVELYLNALQQRYQHRPSDADLRNRIEGARAWLELQTVELP